MRISKIRCYENPCSVTGTGKSANPEELPNGICIDKDVGTWKALNVEGLYPMKR